MKTLERKIAINFHWERPDGADIPEGHIEALDESAWERIVEMAADGFSSGELFDHIRVTDKDPEKGVRYRGWWNLVGAQPEVKRPRVLVVVSGGIADPVYDDGVDVIVFDRDDHHDNPEDTDPVPVHFRDLAELIDVPVEDEGGAV